MKSAIIVLIAAVLLSGCGKAHFNETAKLALPDVQHYTRGQQARAADEIEQNDVPMLEEMMKDYSVMRDQARRTKGN